LMTGVSMALAVVLTLDGHQWSAAGSFVGIIVFGGSAVVQLKLILDEYDRTQKQWDDLTVLAWSDR